MPFISTVGAGFKPAHRVFPSTSSVGFPKETKGQKFDAEIQLKLILSPDKRQVIGGVMVITPSAQVKKTFGRVKKMNPFIYIPFGK